MDNLTLLLVCFVLGIALRRSGRMPEDAHKALNGFIIHISLPALILVYVQRLPLNAEIVFPVLMPWLLFGLGLVLFLTAARVAGWSAQTTGGLILSGSLANTSFVGLPMIETFYGVSFLGLGILIDQLGTYMVLSTVGIFIAAMFSGQGENGWSGSAVLRKICTFAPFQALVLAIALRAIEMPPGVEQILGRLGATLAPLALVSVGYQLRLSDVRGRLPALTVGLLFKLVIGPLLITLVLVNLLQSSGPVTQVTIFEAAMGPQIGAAIVAMEHELDPPLVTLMVGIGIPLSFVTLPLWWWFLQGV
jgi:malate permease and related proteins